MSATVEDWNFDEAVSISSVSSKERNEDIEIDEGESDVDEKVELLGQNLHVSFPEVSPSSSEDLLVNEKNLSSAINFSEKLRRNFGHQYKALES